MSQELDFRLFVASKNKKNAQFTYPGQRTNIHSPLFHYYFVLRVQLFSGLHWSGYAEEKKYTV